MKGSLLVPLLLLAFSSHPGLAEQATPFQDENARINYSVGYQVGGDFQRQGIEIDPELVARGAEDALSGARPLLTQPEMHKELTDLKRRAPGAKAEPPQR